MKYIDTYNVEVTPEERAVWRDIVTKISEDCSLKYYGRKKKNQTGSYVINIEFKTHISPCYFRNLEGLKRELTKV